MTGNNRNFDNKKMKENKKVFQIDDINDNKIQFLKKNHRAQRTHLNILLDIMIIILLDHYV